MSKVLSLLTGIALLAALPVTAATVNTVRFGTGGLGASICAPAGSGTQITGGAPILQEFKTFSDDGHCQQSSVGRAGGGSVGVRASMQADPGAGVPRVDLTARSEFDLMLGVPAGWTGGLIPIRLTSLLGADLEATILAGSPFGRSAGARLRATVELGGFSTLGGVSRVESRNVEDYAASATSPGGTPFGNLLVAEEIATGIINIDPRRAIRVMFELNGSVGGQAFSDSAVTAEVRALNSLGFAPGMPIFDLPEGFTLDAPEFGIVGNRYVGTDPGPAVVPLPAPAFLLLAGCVMLAGLRKRRHRRT